MNVFFNFIWIFLAVYWFYVSCLLAWAEQAGLYSYWQFLRRSDTLISLLNRQLQCLVLSSHLQVVPDTQRVTQFGTCQLDRRWPAPTHLTRPHLTPGSQLLCRWIAILLLPVRNQYSIQEQENIPVESVSDIWSTQLTCSNTALACRLQSKSTQVNVEVAIHDVNVSVICSFFSWNQKLNDRPWTAVRNSPVFGQGFV
jgi:hypothetical protein